MILDQLAVVVTLGNLDVRVPLKYEFGRDRDFMLLARKYHHIASGFIFDTAAFKLLHRRILATLDGNKISISCTCLASSASKKGDFG